MTRPQVNAFFDEATFNVSYVVSDPDTSRCAIIDSVLDYDPAAGRTSTESADKLVAYVKANGLKVEWIIDTHVHADHLTAAPYLKQELGGKIAIGSGVTAVQGTFGGLFNAPESFSRDGSQFDHLFNDGETYQVGSIEARAMHTPGHTPACMSHLIGDAVFVGDTMFMPDFGTARCDFPGGDAGVLYDSIQKLFALPEQTRVFLNHDYKAPGRDEYAWETTIGTEKRENIHVGSETGRDEFIRMRTERDATLDMPKLILPSVQINMRAGDLPEPENNGQRYVKIPLNAL